MGAINSMKSVGGATSASVILAFALAAVLAAHEANTQPDWSLVGVYVYWMCRIGMAWLIMIGAHAALAQVMSEGSSPIAHAGLATALSFPPFLMAITTMDLILGDPELLRSSPDVILNTIGLEAAALIDNHLTVAAVLLAPYVLAAGRRADAETAGRAPGPKAAEANAEEPDEAAAASAAEPVSEEAAIERPGLLLACQPPLRGDLLTAEAQEHYVRLRATEQGGLALYRFGDAVRDLSRYRGMQIHRSYWVADRAVAAIIGRRGSMKLELQDGEIVPVSRRYEIEVEARYGMLERKAEPV
ncbi:MAG: LytTR family DNA-binding domain-containing protein [Pikeienuella sp.]